MKFCIVGTGRCGSKLLMHIFNSHPEIYVFNETHWIVKMYETYGTGSADLERLIHIIQSSYHVTGKQITTIDERKLRMQFQPNGETTIREFCDTLGNMHAHANQKKIWADKTPDYGAYMHILQKIWPDCKFIHLIRHGGDVAISMSKHPGFKWMATARDDWWAAVSYNKYYKRVWAKRNSFEEYAALWYRRLKRIQNEASFLKEGSYKEIYFENLIHDPEKELNNLADFLHLSVSDNWISKTREMIDTDRFSDRKQNHDFLNKKEMELLNELGYFS